MWLGPANRAYPFLGGLSITTASLPGATVGAAYSATLAAQGGVTPYTWWLQSAVPVQDLWLRITGAGALYGTPQYTETDTVVIGVRDFKGTVAYATLTLTVTASGTLTIQTAATLPSAVTGQLYAEQLIISGGQPPYSYSSSVAQPWVVTADGWVLGAPTSTGTVSIPVTVTDSYGTTASRTFSTTVGTGLVIANVDNTLGVVNLPPAIAGSPYEALLSSFGGTQAGQSWTVSSGALPSGLALATATGVISGTPALSGAVNIGVALVDSGSNHASANAAINVLPAAAASRPSYNTGSGLFVNNGYLYDPNGNQLTLGGMNRLHYNSTAWTGGASGAQTNANCCRSWFGNPYGQTVAQFVTQLTSEYIDNGIVPIATFPSVVTQFTGTVSPSSSTTLTVNSISGTLGPTNAGVICLGMVISGSVANGCTITAYGTGTGGTGTYTITSSSLYGASSMTGTLANTSGATDPNVVVGTTAHIVNALSNGLSAIQNNIIINIANEWGPADSSTWQSTYETAVAAIRSAGFLGPLMIDAGSSGQDLGGVISYAAGIQSADSVQNCVFGIHAYGSMFNVVGTITGITNASNAVVTIAGDTSTHPFCPTYPGNNYTEFAQYYLTGVQGMTQINGAQATSHNNCGGSAGSWTITLSVNSSSFGTYTGGGQILVYDPYTGTSPSTIAHPAPYMQEAAALRSSNVCCVVAEFGPGQNVGPSPTTTPPGQVIATAQNYGLGWIPWAWDDNNEGGGETSWTGWFGMTLNGPGTYSRNAPNDLTAFGLDMAGSPRHGWQTVAIPADLTVATTWFGATLPTLPQTTPNPAFTLPAAGSTNNGAYYTPSTLAAAQTAINTAAVASGSGGDVIVLTAGTTYGPGVLTLPAHGTGNGTIYIVSSQIPELGGSLPTAGNRVGPSNTSNMPTIQMEEGQDWVIVDSQSNSPSNNYHLVGLYISASGAITSATQCDDVVGLVTVATAATLSTGIPSNFVIERCVIMGDPTYGAHRGIAASGNNIVVCESYVYNIFDSNVNNNADNQCFASWNCGVGFLLRNNYFNAAGESFLWGGSDPTISGMPPASDITIENNYLYKNPANLGVAGVGYGKNACELKSAVRVLMNSNHIEACWGSQSAAMAITVRNQSNTDPQSQVADITITNNRFWNVIQPGMGFINVSGQDTPSSSGNPGDYSQPTERVLIRNNIFLGSQTTNPGSQMFLITQPTDANQQPSSLVIDHNTFVQLTNGVQSGWLDSASPLASSGYAWANFVWSNNIVAAVSVYGVNNGTTGAAGMTATLADYFTNSCCINNVVLPSSSASDGLPPGNFQPANLAAIYFNATGIDAEYPNTVGYILTSSSPYKGAGVSGANLPYTSSGTPDGTDIGANISEVAE